MKTSSFFLFAASLAGLGTCTIASVQAQSLTISTLAGAARDPGSVDGPNASARFATPYGLAADAQGNVFTVDHGGGVIRRIGAGGGVTTLAPHFFSPYGIALDGNGDIYVSDTLNFVIDRVGPDGTVAVIAGISGSRGTADGGRGTAQLSGPTGIALDGAGDVFVADTNRDSGGGVIRKVAPDGTVTTWAGGFVNPRGIAVAGDGTLFVADEGDNTIRRVAPDGSVSLYAGIPSRTGADDGAAASARFNLPASLALDRAGNLYVADSGNSTVRVVTPAGVVATAAGLAVVIGSQDGTGDAARFYAPAGIAVGADGTVYIADTGNDTVRTGRPVGTGTATAAAAAPNPAAHLINLSVRAQVGAGGNDLVVGFVTSGSADKPVLIRGVGPGLAQYGVGGALAQPDLTVYSSSGAAIAANAGWAGSAQLAAAATSVGAFPLAAGSADSAVLPALPSGAYSAQVTGSGDSTGIALAEIYDADAASPSKLINVSSRAVAGQGAAALVAGFTIGGSGSAKVLIRGIGPTLAEFGVANALAATQLTVFDSRGNPLATQTAWAGDPAVAATAETVGAFTLASDSADSAMVLTLPAGSYSAQLTGANGATGVALIEVYSAE